MIANLVFCAWHAKGDGGRGTVILLVVVGKLHLRPQSKSVVHLRPLHKALSLARALILCPFVFKHSRAARWLLSPGWESSHAVALCPPRGLAGPARSHRQHCPGQIPRSARPLPSHVAPA